MCAPISSVSTWGILRNAAPPQPLSQNLPLNMVSGDLYVSTLNLRNTPQGKGNLPLDFSHLFAQFPTSFLLGVTYGFLMNSFQSLLQPQKADLRLPGLFFMASLVYLASVLLISDALNGLKIAGQPLQAYHCSAGRKKK